MRRGEVFPSNYIKAEDLQGKNVTVRIKDITVEKMGDDEKPVAWFYQKEKGLVLNQTNWDTIENLYGPESDDWNGKSITLYSTKVMFGNKKVDAVRIRDYNPTAPTQPVRPEPNGQTASKKPAQAMTQAEADAGEDDGADDDLPF